MATGWPMKTTYANGDVYSASDVNDITGTINLLGSSVAYTAGKNKFINGDFRINQRAFTSVTTDGQFTFDRWLTGISGGTATYTPQVFTPGTAPVAGYEGTNFLQIVTSQTTTNYAFISQRIEDVRTFAGQTVTISFWAKASSGTPKMTAQFYQWFGIGGSTGVLTNTSNVTISTSWARYSITVAIPSVSGKTITNTNNALYSSIYVSDGGAGGSTLAVAQSNTFQIWGVQIETGSTATAFQTATGTIQGELAACQRYYIRYSATGVYSSFASSAFAQSTTAGTGLFAFPVEMRTAPTAIDSSTLAFSKWDNTHYAMSSVTLDSATTSTKNAYVYGTGSGMTAGNIGYWGANNSASAYIGFSAEL